MGRLNAVCWLCAAVFASSAVFRAASVPVVNPCERQVYQARCPDPRTGQVKPSRFVLRYYRRGGQCVSYPYGHCDQDPDAPVLFKTRQECQLACFGSQSVFGQASFAKPTVSLSASRPSSPASAPTSTRQTVAIPSSTSSTARSSTSTTRRTTLVPTTVTQPTSQSPLTTFTTERLRPTSAAATQQQPELTQSRVAHKSKCEEQRDAAKSAGGTSKSKIFIDAAFVPQCNEDGSFKQVQCDDFARVCWCVDKDGLEIYGTRSVGEDKPNCSPAETTAKPVTTRPIVQQLSMLSCEGQPERKQCTDIQTLRWYFDTTDNACKTFVDGGCVHSGNNYATKVECEQHCLFSVNSSCPRGSFPLTDSHGIPFSCLTDRCPKGFKCHFVSSIAYCCTDLESNDIAAPLKSNQSICSLIKDRGQCNDFQLRFYYDREEKECKRFFYGGCDGNQNNFATLTQCIETCTTSQVQVQGTGVHPADFSPVAIGGSPASVGGASADGHVGGSILLTQANSLFPVSDEDDQMLGGNKCEHPKDTGPCRGEFERWYWSKEHGRCLPFIYGGCKGNGNNFDSEEGCFKTCSELPVDVCQHPLDKGNCGGSFTRWFYDTETQNCKAFFYSGCNGNGNNFDALAACEARCLPGRRSPPPSAAMPLNPITAAVTVLPTTLSGDICSHPLDAGNCQDEFPRWRFNQTSSVCESFNYTGCGGNGNNFDSKLRCELRCVVEECLQTVGYGTCGGQFLRWSYNMTTHQCEPFRYSGCGGNENNFGSKEVCEQKCIQRGAPQTTPATTTATTAAILPQSPSAVPAIEVAPAVSEESSRLQRVLDICTHPMDRGNCEEQHQRWAFDANTETCVAFNYSGCGGNDNNFETLLSCERYCILEKTVDGALLRTKIITQSATLPTSTRRTFPIKPRPTVLPLNVCHHPLDPGPCSGRFFRWYYDDDDGTCKQFIYSGCDGNGNNFPSENECSRRCGSETKSGKTPVRRPVVVSLPPDMSKNICFHPKNEGTCRGIFPRWYYVSELDVCKSFVYGGCGGNGNNFNSKQACEAHCSRRNKISPAASAKGDAKTSMWTSPKSTVCTLPKARGECDKYQLRFFYNNAHGRCEHFFYSSCGGNENNFNSLEACEMVCGDKPVVPFAFGANKKTTPEDDDEQLVPPPSAGYGGGIDHRTVIGPPGLAPNPPGYAPSTPLEEVDKSKSADSSAEPSAPDLNDICSLMPERGPCAGIENRWFWNKTSGMCEIFQYGGCEGNVNNFKTEQECTDRCGARPESVCYQEKDEGYCGGSFARYYYDRKIKSCVMFNYSGCGGNGNNFDSIRECRKTCCFCKSTTVEDMTESTTTTVAYRPATVITKASSSTTPKQTTSTQKATTSSLTASSEATTSTVYVTRTLKTTAHSTSTTAASTKPTTVIELPEANVTGVTCKPVKCRSHCMVIRDKNNCKSCYCPHRTTTPPPPCKQLDESECSDRSCIIITDDQDCKVCLCPPLTEEDKKKPGKEEETTTKMAALTTVATATVPSVDVVTDQTSTAAAPSETTSAATQEEGTTECADLPHGSNPMVECREPLDAGQCTGPYEERWWFDAADSQCKMFQYSGCGGNRNHFFSYDECQRYCGAAAALPSGDAAIAQPSDMGYAQQYLPKQPASYDPADQLVALYPQVGPVNVWPEGDSDSGISSTDTQGRSAAPETVPLVTTSFDPYSAELPSNVIVPECPDGELVLKYRNGTYLLCLPGQSNCPDKAGCNFNGLDYFCCTSPNIGEVPSPKPLLPQPLP